MPSHLHVTLCINTTWECFNENISKSMLLAHFWSPPSPEGEVWFFSWQVAPLGSVVKIEMSSMSFQSLEANSKQSSLSQDYNKQRCEGRKKRCMEVIVHHQAGSPSQYSRLSHCLGQNKDLVSLLTCVNLKKRNMWILGSNVSKYNSF